MRWNTLKLLLLDLPVPARAVVVVTCLSSSIALAAILIKVWSLSWEGWQEVTSTGPRIARLQGYELARDEIIDARRVASLAMEQLAFIVVPGDDRVGAQLQQTLRGFAETAGLTVSGSQLVQNSKDDSIPEGFEGLVVQLGMVGEPEALTVFLTEVYEYTPHLSVLKLNMVSATKRQSRRRSNEEPSKRDEQNLTIDVHVMALTVSL